MSATTSATATAARVGDSCGVLLQRGRRPCAPVAPAAPPRRCAAVAASPRVRAVAAAASTDSAASTVLLTREAGKNAQLERLLAASGVRCVEVPLIEHGPAADRARLPDALRQSWDWVVITSPEAAAVFLEGWDEAGRPPLRVASVGAGTSAALKAGGAPVAFAPSKATAETLAAELPSAHGGAPCRVLYPSSARARKELQSGLAARTDCVFEVTRLNTYTTAAVGALSAEQRAAAAAAAVVTFASPSAVDSFCRLLRSPAGAGAAEPAAACIGETSAEACHSAGFARVYYPAAPGVDGWAAAVLAALRGDAPPPPP